MSSELESPALRLRDKKLSSNKLSALEKLKKARLGEKIDDDEEEDDDYEYVEEEEMDHEDQIDKYKREKNNKKKKQQTNSSKKYGANDAEEEENKDKLAIKKRKNLTRDKLTTTTGTVKSSTLLKEKINKTEEDVDMDDDVNVEEEDDDDDGVEEEEEEKQKKKTKTKSSKEKEKAATVDIRDAFFKMKTAAAKPQVQAADIAKKPTPAAKKKPIDDDDDDDENSQNEDGDGDDIMNEIMRELKKSTKPTTASSSAAHKQTHQMAKQQQQSNQSITMSPAHKRKLSPTSNTSAAAKNRQSLSYDKESKKIELDSDLMEQLLKSDSSQSQEETNKKNTTTTTTMPNFQVKSEPIDAQEEMDNLQLISSLSLDYTLKSSKLAAQLDLPPIKIESMESTMATATNETSGEDIEMHMRDQANANRLLFYWYDCFEEHSSGIVYLFGKMPIVKRNNKEKKEKEPHADSASSLLTFVSVCLIIHNIPHVVHVLPRKFKRNSKDDQQQHPITMQQVGAEVDELMKKYKISNYKTRVVHKNYAFDRRIPADSSYYDSADEIPFESDYLEVEFHLNHEQKSNNNYNNKQAAVLPIDLQGECFSAVLGTQTTYAEHLIIDLKLKGPCWLLVNGVKSKDPMATGAMVSWCKLEFSVENYRNISVYREGVTLDSKVQLPQTPPLIALTLITRTMLNAKSQEHEIVCASGLVTSKFYLEKGASCQSTAKGGNNLFDSCFCAIARSSNTVFPYDFTNALGNLRKMFLVEVCNSERQLLAFLLSKIISLDVDIIVGHDLFGFNFDILLSRCLANKVPHWSRFGRLKRSVMPQMGNSYSKNHHHQGQQTGGNSTFNNSLMQQRISTVCAGRLLCDIVISAKELLTKCKSYELAELVSHVLKRKSPADSAALVERDYEKEKQVSIYFNNSKSLTEFMQLSLMDASDVLKICNEIQCLQLAYQITCITGMILSRTLTGGRSERNEYLLLHAFHDKDYLLPDKFVPFSSKSSNSTSKSTNKSLLNNTASVKKEPLNISTQQSTQMDWTAVELDNDDEDTKKDMVVKSTAHHASNGYTGGLVLEPKVGFYDRFILLLDFNSLYPSIIQEYNICFTTISRPNLQLAEKDIDEYLETCIKLPSEDTKPGILPTEIKKLVDSRRQVKQLLQDKNLSADLKMQYDIRQKALKLTANSVYGCLGFENSRFYCKPLAALITKFGRNILIKTKELVESKKIEVIYGDTDSIMINTNLNDYDQVLKLGNSLKAEVNKFYKHLEIDIDNVFKALLLLRKKKYAALVVDGRNPKDPQALLYHQELKGLDVIRRDWSPIAKQIGEKVVDEILSGQACDTVLTNINKILDDTAERLKSGSFDLSLFEISKQLNRNPEDYNDSNHQPHVLVALRHNQDVNNSKKFKSGDVVSYIVCEDGTNNSATQRAYSKGEYLKQKESGKLKLDIAYYLRQQIHPVVTRLCDPIEGIDAAHVAQSLGLDPAGFRNKSSSNSTSGGLSIAPPTLTKQQKKLESFMNEIERYSNCVPFKYTCPGCKTENNWQAPFIKTSETIVTVKQEPSAAEVKMEDEEDYGDIQIDESSIVVTNKKPAAAAAGANAQSTTSRIVSHYKSILDACSNAQCKLKPSTRLAYIKNQLTLQLNKYIKQYYQGWLVCEDPMCSCRTKRISCKFFKGLPQCVECERYAASLEYSHADLYYQMKFFKFIFDVEAFKSYYKNDSNEIAAVLARNRELASSYNQLKEFLNKRLKLNAYGSTNLSDLFKSSHLNNNITNITTIN